jgi:acyl carrier protein
MQTTEESQAPITRDRLLALFCQTASEIVEREFSDVKEGTPITELAIDSLGMLEIIGSLERQLRIQIPDESLTGLNTIRDLLDVVEKRTQ